MAEGSKGKGKNNPKKNPSKQGAKKTLASSKENKEEHNLGRAKPTSNGHQSSIS